MLKTIKLVKVNRSKYIVENSYIDAMVVELVPTGIESLGVMVEHLLKANRADVRVLQVHGQTQENKTVKIMN